MKKINHIIISIGCLMALLVTLISFSFTSYAVENEAVEDFADAVVEISGYEVEGGYIQAGKESTITLTLHNTSSNSAAQSLVVTLTSQSNLVYPAYGKDNQIYVGTLKGGDATTVEIPVIAVTELTGDYVDISCDLTYETGKNRVTYTSKMVIPTQNVATIAVSSIDMSAHATLNGKSLLTLTYSNNGTNNINDAVLVIDGNVSDATQTIDLGNIVAGKSYTKDCNVIFTELGEQSITVTLKYTDVDGESVESELGTFKVNVGEESVSGVASKPANMTLALAGRIIALVALCLAAVATFVYIKKR